MKHPDSHPPRSTCAQISKPSRNHAYKHETYPARAVPYTHAPRTKCTHHPLHPRSSLTRTVSAAPLWTSRTHTHTHTHVIHGRLRPYKCASRVISSTFLLCIGGFQIHTRARICVVLHAESIVPGVKSWLVQTCNLWKQKDSQVTNELFESCWPLLYPLAEFARYKTDFMMQI